MTLAIDPPVHPGEYLREELLAPLGLSPEDLAARLHVPPASVRRLVGEEAGVTADLALRLAAFFGLSAEFWLNLQQAYDLSLASKRLSADLDAIQRFASA